MQRASVHSILRRLVLLIGVVAVVAGCTVPDESTAPEDVSTDRDRNGIPDAEEQDPGPVVTNDTMTDDDAPILTPDPDLANATV